MLRIVNHWSGGTDVDAELQRICDRTHDSSSANAEATVQKIIQEVQRRGDAALLDYSQEFDGVTLTAEQLRVSSAELTAAYEKVPKDFVDAVQVAHANIQAFHEQRVPKSWVKFGDDDVVLGKRYTAVDVAGLYVPGGKASYPSTVLMNAVPATVAGVERRVMVTPPSRDGSLNPAVLVAAQVAGIREIYRVGGAQAIAALAYGTETIPPVNVITGPGNIYVTLAKKIVYGRVGIDSLAGPSEVLIIADESANPAHVAVDMLAQAEHDTRAAAILITTSESLAQAVVEEVSSQLEQHPRREITEKAIANYGLIIVARDLDEAVTLSNKFAPEHLELEVTDPWALMEGIRHAGAIFLGRSTPEAVGDYLAGPNHTLPTSGAARYASALGVETFMKHSSIIQYSPEALGKMAGSIDTLATAEGLFSHAESVRMRQQGPLDQRNS